MTAPHWCKNCHQGVHVNATNSVFRGVSTGVNGDNATQPLTELFVQPGVVNKAELPVLRYSNNNSLAYLHHQSSILPSVRIVVVTPISKTNGAVDRLNETHFIRT